MNRLMRLKNGRGRAGFTALLLAFAVPAQAAVSVQSMSLGSFVDATSLEQLADMVVTDAKVAQSPDSVTQHILVLRAEDLEQTVIDHRHLAEWMRHTAGQFVNVLSRNDANWGSYAGLGPKYNTWLLDGLPVDSFVDPMNLDPSVVERVEVHKGPASVLYSNYLTMDFAGNESPLAGTTNLVLKNRVESPLTRVSAGLGSLGTVQGKIWHQGRVGDLSYFAGLGTESADYTQFGATGSWLQTTEDPDYRKTRAFANLSQELGRANHTLSVFFHHTEQDGDMGRPNRDMQHRYDTLNLTYNNQFSPDWHLQFKAGERRYDRQFGNDDYGNTLSLALTSHDRTRQTIRPMDLTLSYLHSENSLLTLGADHQSVDYETRSRTPAGVETVENDASARSLGVFLQEKLQWDNWVFRAGVRRNRIDHDYALLGGNLPAVREADWSHNLWSLGLRRNSDAGVAVYANMGSSFMVPSAKQIGGTVSAPGASGQLPNPSLTPETGLGRDLGLEWRFGAGMNFHARVFLNSIQDAIVDNAVGATQAISVNAGQARAAGLELELRQTQPDSDSWFANLTFSDTRLENSSNADQDGTEIPFAPDLTGNLGFTALMPGQWRVSPYFHWIGRYYDSASRSGRKAYGHYGTFNLHASRPVGRNTKLSLDLVNLGNRRYAMPWDFRDPGFSGLASLQISW